MPCICTTDEMYGLSERAITWAFWMPSSSIDAFVRLVATIGRNESSDQPRRDPETQRLVVEVTQEQLADATGLSRETVNKYLHILRDQGIIQVNRGRISVASRDDLAGMGGP